jgi:hypothetical protein
VRDHVPVGVDRDRDAVREHRVRAVVKLRDEGGEQLGLGEIVVGVPHEQRRARELHHRVDVARGPQVRLLPHVTDPRIARRILEADRGRPVGGGVVRDDELEVGERLGQEPVQGQAQVPLAVVDRHPDRDAW